MSVDSSGLETGELEQKGRGGGGKGRLYNCPVLIFSHGRSTGSTEQQVASSLHIR